MPREKGRRVRSHRTRHRKGGKQTGVPRLFSCAPPTPREGPKMSWFFRLLRSRWVRTGFGVILACVLIWFCGPLICLGSLHPFETETVRWITIVVLLVGWLVLNLMADLLGRQRGK